MSNILTILQEQRTFFAKGHTKDVNFRIHCLKKLAKWVRENDKEILSALKVDLNKPAFEAYASEIGIVLDELHFALRHIKRWTHPQFVLTNLKNFPSYGRIYPEPYGVALIISPWNYPFMLTVVPVIAAVAAGNCAVIKPSEYASATSGLIARMCAEVFCDGHINVAEGGLEINQILLAQRFDKIFFTGSTEVGRIVMAAGAKCLTPVTLELGGKSPCVVDQTANIKLAARRIIWGKFINAGQTCVAPDYLLVHASVKDRLIGEMAEEIRKQYGDNPCQNADYCKIINERHFRRLTGLMEKENGNGHIVHGGGHDESTLQIEPTLIDGVSWDDVIMDEEIFGPILPVLTYSDGEEMEMARRINGCPKPLAFYVFTGSRSAERFWLGHVVSGGGCVNDVVVQLSVPWLPFGGVGESGMGSYHGKAGFDAFTHYRSVLYKSRFVDMVLRYPPYSGFA
ncbi:MAG: aldehyde dehydrogenase, partial [Defluviitaleaceae bacterium]|nr:aldehyde dehydrogenase [Defluviitaleaceae bacterium]